MDLTEVRSRVWEFFGWRGTIFILSFLLFAWYAVYGDMPKTYTCCAHNSGKELYCFTLNVTESCPPKLWGLVLDVNNSNNSSGVTPENLVPINLNKSFTIPHFPTTKPPLTL